MDITKKNDVNALLDFYGGLLTLKQRRYLVAYFADDLSIVEIAENEQVSRQAVSDNIHRGVDLLKHYETILHLQRDYVARRGMEHQLEQWIDAHYNDDATLKQRLNMLINYEETD
ncbi:YlxM family DNA-binding protein [Leuconostoc fallax]|uniref:YlxM family DNA-binding protein n=1 Tax=Leuconostoc fallax TaxID=1251 RepID=UPI00209175DC|nr:DNA-binding protein [Leuconostoc fallax]MCO6184527.1 DNA-binding protein [Leuconostoc fallax]